MAWLLPLAALAACTQEPPVILPAAAHVPVAAYDAARAALPEEPAPGAAQSVIITAARQGVAGRRLATVGDVLTELARGHAVVLGQGVHAPAIAVGYDMPSDSLLVSRGDGVPVEPQPLADWRPNWQGAARWAVAVGPTVAQLTPDDQLGELPADP